ncbi:MAG: twin-arginine translocase TatA/TatE family subunit [Magnetococcales bacterium]|nr:twin-arginine translocase TatA/TatE family subunit [Magnetococcales bacterium]
MLGMGWSEIFIIVIIGLLVIGPDKLPEVARGIAKTIRQVHRFANDIRDSINLDELEASTKPGTPQNPHQPPGSSGLEGLNPDHGLGTGPNTGLDTRPEPGLDLSSDMDEDPTPVEPVQAKPEPVDTAQSHSHGAEPSPNKGQTNA